MYNLPYHREENQEVTRQLIEKYPFAFLAGCNGTQVPVATQVPLFFDIQDGVKTLSGHIMKDSDHHKAFMENPQVLAVFTSKHCYVSGSWYSNPRTPSTWNYMSVHAKGVIRFLENDALEKMLRRTTLHFENSNAQSPTVFDNLDPNFLQKAMKWIIAFEIKVTEMDTVIKLSQDRDAQSYRNIISKLNEQDENAREIASEMEKRYHTLFPS